MLVDFGFCKTLCEFAFEIKMLLGLGFGSIRFGLRVPFDRRLGKETDSTHMLQKPREMQCAMQFLKKTCNFSSAA